MKMEPPPADELVAATLKEAPSIAPTAEAPKPETRPPEARPAEPPQADQQRPQSKALTVVPKAKLPAGRRVDQEFLPAALEIITTPPSPVNVGFIWCICLFFAAALTWSWFGKIDIHAVAQGRIQPSGRSKVVQPLEPGKVRAVFVENGATVKEGDVLVELDPTETAADKDALQREVEAAEAEIARRNYAIQAALSGAKDEPALVFPGAIDGAVQRRERAVLAADLAQLNSTRESLLAQLAERGAQRDRLNMSIKARDRLLVVLKQRVNIRQTLVDKQAGTLSAVIDGSELLERAATEQATDRGQLMEVEASSFSINRKLSEITTQFVADQSQKLAEAERRFDKAKQELIKASSREGRTRLVSPISGTVQQLAVTSLGQVVMSGQALLTVVPSNSRIEVEANVLNQDIGFVDVGQEAVVKVEAFPFTRFGTIPATVVKISRDAIDEQEANGLASPQGASQRQSNASALNPTARSQNLVFPATIQLNRTSINVEGREVPLTPGMAVTVEIRTGERRVIDYIFSPLSDLGSKAGRER